MDQQEIIPGEEQKTYKTPEAKRLKAIERYKNKKDDILKMISLKTIMANGRIPSQNQMVKHNLSWEDVSRALQEWNKERESQVPIEVQNTEAKIKLIEWNHELDRYKKIINRGSTITDDMTRLYRKYIETFKCENCNECFSKENPRIWNMNENTGFFELIICKNCLPKENSSGQ